MEMLTNESRRAKDYARATAAIVRAMSLERAAQVYDFARFLQTQPSGPSPIPDDSDGWLNDSEEQMQAEDALWDAAYARHSEEFSTLRETARQEIQSGLTKPLFDERCLNSHRPRLSGPWHTGR
jgi:hypothetical protein